MRLRNKLLSIFLSIFLITSLMGCSSDNILQDTTKDFDKFTEDLFIEEVQSDSLTLNYTLSNPKAYDIEMQEVTLGEFTLESFEASMIETEKIFNQLKEFDYKQLTDSQKLTYDILYAYLETELSSKDLLLYPEVLSPTIGMQAQLPVLLAEFNFHTKEDIDIYIELLPQVYDYFKDIIDFQKEKSANGLFMADFAVDAIVKQCRDFIATGNDNYLIDVFNDKINDYPSLTKEEKKTYKQANKKAISEYIIPAYQLIIDELSALKGTGTNEGGLVNFDKGKDYYSYLVKSSTGSSKSISNINKKLESTILKNALKMNTIFTDKPEILELAESADFISSDPEEIINILKESMTEEFPELPDVNYTIKYVHESLQESVSPAFYLIPPIDAYEDNVIYINKGSNFDASQLFTTLAHEGYPGHLYQTVYFHSQNTNNLRQLLSFSGYAEGWATYVEHSSYHWGGLDEDVASLLEMNYAISLSISSRVDTGVNYEGWDLKKTTEFLNNYGIADDETIKSIYESVIMEPANYLKYCLGYLEFLDLKTKASNELGSNFNVKDFNEFLLKTGPAQFYVIDKYMDSWIEDNK